MKKAILLACALFATAHAGFEDLDPSEDIPQTASRSIFAALLTPTYPDSDALAYASAATLWNWSANRFVGFPSSAFLLHPMGSISLIPIINSKGTSGKDCLFFIGYTVGSVALLELGYGLRCMTDISPKGGQTLTPSNAPFLFATLNAAGFALTAAGFACAYYGAVLLTKK